MRANLHARLFLVTTLAFLQLGPLTLRAQESGENLRPDEMSDLVVSGLSLSPLYPLPGETVDVDAGVYNRSTHAEKKLAVVLFAGGTKIALQTIDLKSGEKRTLRFSWQPKEEGQAKLTLRLDPDQTRVALDRREWETSIETVVARRPATAADFAVSSLQFGNLRDQPSSLRAVITNKGTAAASAPLVVRVDGLVAGMQLVIVPAGGREAVEIPWPAAGFDGQFSAEINPRFRADEKTPGDNLLSKDLRPPLGLAIQDLSISTTQSGSKGLRQATLGFRIVNTGRSAITKTFRTLISGSPGAAGKPPGSYSMTTQGLPVEGSVYVSRTIALPPGGLAVNVEADADHKIQLPSRTSTIATANFAALASSKTQWNSIGPNVIVTGTAQFRSNGRVTAIAIDPSTPSTIYVGAVGSGVWKTADGGGSWAPVTDSLPSLDVAAIAVDPTTPSNVYVALVNAGVFRSTDAGASWTQLSTDLGAEVRWGVLIVSPADPRVIFLTTSAGVYRSGNSGVTWRLSNSRGRATDLVIDPTNPKVLYAGISGVGIYKTTTGGVGGNRAWVQLTSGLPSSDVEQVTLALCRGTPGTIYAGYSRTSGYQLYRTNDSGASWSVQTTAPFSDLYNDDIGVDPADPNTVYITGVGFYRSTDGGATFSAISGLHADNHAFASDPVTAGLIYVGDDGGIYQSPDRGNSWTFLGTGMANTELYDIADAATQPNIVIAGVQDNGNIKYDASSTVWNQIGGFGDGATVDIDPTNEQVLYAMGQGIDSLARSSDGGVSFMNIAGGLPPGIGKGGCAVYNTHFQVHPTQANIMLASPSPCGPLYQTTNTQPPGNWAALFTPPAGSVVRSAVDPSVNLYYAGTTDGHLYAGAAGANWQDVFTHPAGAVVSDIEIDSEDPATVYAAFSGTGAGRVYRLRRSSAAPVYMTANDITSDLPFGLTIGPVSPSGGDLAVDRLLPLTIYVGTNHGVYCGRTSDGGNTWYWLPYMNGMPAANVADLEVQPTTGALRAATFGRAAYEVYTDDPIGSLLGADGRVTLLRVHDLGTGYGPPTDFLDVEVVAWLDSMPGRAFGFQLRSDANQSARRGMLKLLRLAFNNDRQVHIDYIRTGFRNGRILRVWFNP